MVMVLKKGSDKKRIEAIFSALISGKSKSKGVDAYKYCGVLNQDKDALSIQKEMRSEWD